MRGVYSPSRVSNQLASHVRHFPFQRITSHLAMVTKELEHFPFSKGSLLVLYSAQE
jgi:hypothetical protein